MRIDTNDIPQADDLLGVVQAVECISSGGSTFQDIASVLGYDVRQGRYYRRAAEMLGFLARTGTNRSSVTDAGRKVLDLPGAARRAELAKAVVSVPLFQRLIPFLESAGSTGRTREELLAFLGGLSTTTGAMVSRRLSTLLSWLRYTDLVTFAENRYRLSGLPAGVASVDYTLQDEPILPSRFDLSEYNTVAGRCSTADQDLQYTVSAVARERASAAHASLVDIVAERLRAGGAVPRSNPFIDLAAVVAGTPFIFEMKSMTESNCLAQMRRGLSQLYEYRYRQMVPEARLVLVVERPFPSSTAWAVDYLLIDRQIAVLWDGSGQLYCDSRLRDEFEFLL